MSAENIFIYDTELKEKCHVRRKHFISLIFNHMYAYPIVLQKSCTPTVTVDHLLLFFILSYQVSHLRKKSYHSVSQ